MFFLGARSLEPLEVAEQQFKEEESDDFVPTRRNKLMKDKDKKAVKLAVTYKADDNIMKNFKVVGNTCHNNEVTAKYMNKKVHHRPELSRSSSAIGNDGLKTHHHCFISLYLANL